MSGILDFVVQFFSTPAIVLALVSFVGLLVQKKTVQEIVSGTFKTVLGFLIMGLGIGGIIDALGPISTMFSTAYALEGFVGWDEPVIAGIAPVLGTQTALILLFGFILNVILARITPWKYIYLTGHMLWIHAGEFALIFWAMGLSTPAVIVLGSILQGLYTTIFPAISQGLIRKMTGNNEIALGHGNTLAYVVSVRLAQLFGKSEVNAEEMPMPKGLEFFRDMAISMSLIMLIVAIPAALIAGQGYVEAELSGGQNFLMFAFLKALGFTAGVLVLLQGVRMLIAELVPAFRGISQSIVPGCIPALDCPIIIPYGTTSVLLGTVVGTIAQVVAIIVLVILRWPIPLPSMIGGFFVAGHAAVLGNIVGGRRTAIIAAFFSMFLYPLAMSMSYQVGLFGDMAEFGITGLYPGTGDAMFIAAIVRGIGAIFGLGR
jgi:PTS system ascorbate-specific IIC component